MVLSELWEAWEVEFLLLVSLLVQVLLLIFTEWRRRVSGSLLSAMLNGIVWLLYQMADSVSLYVLGHMSMRSKPHEQQQLMAFWASLLLVHLGGQDTITAYAIEDNSLWLRHLFTLVVQAAGAAFVLYKYVAGGSKALLAAAVLMFLVGFFKYGERIYALYSSGLDSISKFLDGFEMPETHIDTEYPLPANSDDDEEVLQGAHDFLHVCMGQLVDYKVWPSKFQTAALSAYHERTHPGGTTAGRSKLLDLVGMQLSLMRDILYTKAVVIHTRYGCVSRFVSTVSTIVGFYLFHQSTIVGSDYSKGDLVVTYVLLAGALFLEVASLLRAVVSTWTCTWLRSAGWNRLHAVAVSLRRGVKAAQRCRRWSGSIGQHDLSEFCRHSSQTGVGNVIASWVGLEPRWNRLCFLDSVVISHDVEDLLLREIHRMVAACNGKERILWAYRGQLALRGWGGTSFYDGVGVEEIGFDGSILSWYYATDVFVKFFVRLMTGHNSTILQQQTGLSNNMMRQVNNFAPIMGVQEWLKQLRHAEAILTLSRYMVFLLVERPHLLPSPARRSQYDNFYAEFMEFPSIMPQDHLSTILPGVNLAKKLLARSEVEGMGEVLRVISGVWVEMLCHAASHCSNDSHARQLSSGTEFITVVWILTSAFFNCFYRGSPTFLAKASHFLGRHDRRGQSNRRPRAPL